jgi:signal transduction histidine kinase
VNDLEKTILKYLESRDDGWTWMRGTQVYTKEKTIELFKKDKKFRKTIIEQAHLLAIDLFIRGAEKKK